MESQLAALRAVLPALPVGPRRALLDTISNGLLADQMRGGEIGLPTVGGPLAKPSDLARILLSTDDFPVERRAATRAAFTAWLAEDDAIVASALDATVADLRNGKLLHELSLPIKTQRARGEVAKRHLPLVIAASGATWLLKAQSAPPKYDESRLKGDDLAVTGAVASRRAFAGDSPGARARDFLPAPIEAALTKRVLLALAPTDDQRALVEQVLADYTSSWMSDVEPSVRTTQEADVASDPHIVRGVSLEGAPAKASEADAARRAAFAAAERVDHALFENLGAVLGEAARPTLRRLEASRRIEEAVASIGWDHVTWGQQVDSEMFGGIPFDLAGWLDDPAVPAPARRAAEAVASERWSTLESLRKDTLATRFDRRLATRLAMLGGSRDDDGKNIDNVFQVNWHAAAEIIDRWRSADDGLTPSLIAATIDAGAAEDDVRFAVDRRRYPTLLLPGAGIQEWLATLRMAAAFDGKDALLQRVSVARAAIFRLSRKGIALASKRVLMVDLHLESVFDAGLGWRRRDLQLAQWNVSAVTLWLIAERAPAEAIASSEVLVKAVAGMR